ncbi:MAG: glutathione S-transferase family protein [Betaproteobacteria bacterium]
MIELYHEWNSVHSFKVRVVLAEKKLEWQDRRLELLKFEHLRPQYLKLNPNGVVPTLIHDGKVILESTVICRYLDEVFASPPLLPMSPFERARARAWLKTFDDVAHPAIRRASFQLLYRPLLKAMGKEEVERRLASHPDPARAQAFRNALEGDVDRAAIEHSVAEFRRLVRRIDDALQGEWLAGDAFSLADVAMAPFAERLAHLRMAGLFEGKARGWMERVLARPSMQASRAPQEHRFPAPA